MVYPKQNEQLYVGPFLSVWYIFDGTDPILVHNTLKLVEQIVYMLIIGGL